MEKIKPEIHYFMLQFSEKQTQHTWEALKMAILGYIASGLTPNLKCCNETVSLETKIQFLLHGT